MLLRIVYSVVWSYAQFCRSLCCYDCQCSRFVRYCVVALLLIACWCDCVSSYILTFFSAQLVVHFVISKCSFYFCSEFWISFAKCLLITVSCYGYWSSCDLYSSCLCIDRFVVIICHLDLNLNFCCYILVLLQICCPGLSIVVAVLYFITIYKVLHFDRMVSCIIDIFVVYYFYVFRTLCLCDRQFSWFISYCVVTLYCFAFNCDRILPYILSCFSWQVVSDLLFIRFCFSFHSWCLSCCEFWIFFSKYLWLILCFYYQWEWCDCYRSCKLWYFCVVRIRYLNKDCCICDIFILGQVCSPGCSIIVTVLYLISGYKVLHLDRMVLRIVYSIIRSYFYCFLSIGCCDCQCACYICYVVVTLYCFSCWCNRVCSYILTSFSADCVSNCIFS